MPAVSPSSRNVPGSGGTSTAPGWPTGAGVSTRAGQAGQRVDECGAAAGVLQAHLANVAFQVARGQQREESVLHGLGDPLAERGPQLREPLDQPGVRDQPARAEPRGQHLRRGPEVDDHFGVHAVQRGQRPDVVTELAVVVVLDDDRAAVARPGGQRLPPADREAAAERVLVRGGRIEQPQVAGKLVGDYAVGVDAAGHDLRASPAQHLPGGRVARFFDADLVPGAQQRRRQRAPGRRTRPGSPGCARG